MTSLDFTAEVTTRVRGYATNYLSARAACAAFDTSSYLGQTYVAPNYSIFRVFLKFNTATIPDDASITQANIKMAIKTTKDITGGAFEVYFKKLDWSASDPIDNGNRESVYDGCLAADTDALWKNVDAGASVNTYYTSDNLDISRINKSGYTYYSLIIKPDIDGSWNGGNQYLQIAPYNDANYPPVLTVEYSVNAVAKPVQAILIGF